MYKEVAALNLGKVRSVASSAPACFVLGGEFPCMTCSQVSLSHPKLEENPAQSPFLGSEMANWVGLTGELFRADAATFGPAGNISPWCHSFLSNHQLQIKSQTSLTFRDFEQ